MFDDPTRVAIQQNLLEFGNALAGRGVDLNEAIGQLKPLVQLLTPVMKNLADPNTGLSNFVSSLVSHRRRGRSGGADPGPALRRPRHDLRCLRPRRTAVHPGVDLEGSRGRGHGDRDPADHPSLPRQHDQALRRAAAGLARNRSGAEGRRKLDRQRRQGPGPLARLERPAGSDGAVPPQPVEQRAGAARNPAADPVQHHTRPAAGLHHAGAVRLQLRIDPVQQRRQPGQLQRRGRERAALHRAPAPARRGQRDWAQLRAGQWPGWAARPTSSTTTPTRTPPRRARRASARRATRAIPAGLAIGNVPGNQGIHTSGQILQQIASQGTPKKKKKGKK